MESVVRWNKKPVERDLRLLFPSILSSIQRKKSTIVLLVDVSNIFFRFMERKPGISEEENDRYFKKRKHMGCTCHSKIRRFILDNLDTMPHISPLQVNEIRDASRTKTLLWIFVMQASILDPPLLSGTSTSVGMTTFPRKPCIVLHVTCRSRQGRDCFLNDRGEKKNPMDDYVLLRLQENLGSNTLMALIASYDRFREWPAILSKA
jgi:hypothetical protein